MKNQSEMREYNHVELVRLDQGHWDFGQWYKQRVTSKNVKYLLLNHKDTIVRNGDICYLQVKKLGFGVCDISFAPIQQTPRR